MLSVRFAQSWRANHLHHNNNIARKVFRENSHSQRKENTLKTSKNPAQSQQNALGIPLNRGYWKYPHSDVLRGDKQFHGASSPPPLLNHGTACCWRNNTVSRDLTLLTRALWVVVLGNRHIIGSESGISTGNKSSDTFKFIENAQ